MVARWAHNPKVIGSNPFSATKGGSTYVEPLLLLYIYACPDSYTKSIAEAKHWTSCPTEAFPQTP